MPLFRDLKSLAKQGIHLFKSEFWKVNCHKLSEDRECCRRINIKRNTCSISSAISAWPQFAYFDLFLLFVETKLDKGNSSSE